MGHPRPLFHLFSSFKSNITIFTTNTCVRKCPSSIRCWDSNPPPSERESHPITTRPVLPPFYSSFYNHFLRYFLTPFGTYPSFYLTTFPIIKVPMKKFQWINERETEKWQRPAKLFSTFLLVSVWPWSSLVEGDEGWIGPSKKLLCLSSTQKITQHVHGIIP